MDPYRDNREALRARALELDRLIGERRMELAGLKFGRFVASLKWLIPAALVLAFAAAGTLRRNRDRPAPASSEKWRARVIASSHVGVPPGSRCTVELDKSCAAAVICGGFAYHGVGRCERGNYFDEAATSADGNPMCEIIDDRVILREFIRMSDDSSRHQSWQIELGRDE